MGRWELYAVCEAGEACSSLYRRVWGRCVCTGVDLFLVCHASIIVCVHACVRACVRARVCVVCALTRRIVHVRVHVFASCFLGARQEGVVEGCGGGAKGDLDRQAPGQQLRKGHPRDKQGRRSQRQQVKEGPRAGESGFCVSSQRPRLLRPVRGQAHAAISRKTQKCFDTDGLTVRKRSRPAKPDLIQGSDGPCNNELLSREGGASKSRPTMVTSYGADMKEISLNI